MWGLKKCSLDQNGKPLNHIHCKNKVFPNKAKLGLLCRLYQISSGSAAAARAVKLIVFSICPWNRTYVVWVTSRRLIHLKCGDYWSLCNKKSFFHPNFNLPLLFTHDNHDRKKFIKRTNFLKPNHTNKHKIIIFFLSFWLWEFTTIQLPRHKL